MTIPPWLVFAFLSALALALGYQLVRRRFGKRVVGYWLVIFAAFLGAEALAEKLGWNMTRLGDLRLAPDVGGALLAVLLLWLLGV